jgi:tetratricopeptide (TPR) repeat protein
MGRCFVSSCLGLILLGVFAWAQTGLPAQQEEPSGLRTAPPPRRIEPPSPAASVEELERRGDELRSEKFFLDAIDYYRTALSKSRTPALYNKRGIAYLQLQRFKDAIKDFKRASKHNRQEPEYYNNLGAAYYCQAIAESQARGRNELRGSAARKVRNAVKQYLKALELRPDSASFHSNLATAYFALKEFDRASIEYGRALQLDPDILERTSLGGISARLSSPEDRAHYSYVIAKMYAQFGNADRSLQYLRKALEEGYKGIDGVYEEKAFAELRKDPRFGELMAQKPTPIQ